MKITLISLVLFNLIITLLLIISTTYFFKLQINFNERVVKIITSQQNIDKDLMEAVYRVNLQ